MEFKKLFPEVLYHSYIVEGEPTPTSLSLCEFLKDREGDEIEILCQNYDSFAIADSEVIKEWHSQKSVDGKKRVCIIATKFINHDAERTLLKMIEEPSLHTHFFIVIPNSKILLDTIRSRAHVIKSNLPKDFTMAGPLSTSKTNHIGLDSENKNIEKEAKDFLKVSLKDKFEIIEKLVKAHKDEDLDSGGLRYHAIELLNQIEKFIYDKWQKTKSIKEDKKAGLPNMENNSNLIKILEEIGEKRSYLNQPGSSVKMILEHIALMLE